MSADPAAGSRVWSAGRILLRLLTEADAPLYCALYTDPDTMRFIGPPLSAARALRSMRRALALNADPAATQRYLAVCEKTGGAAIGVCGVKALDNAGRCAETGIILHPCVRRKDCSKEAFAGLVDASFTILPADELQAHISVDHLAAQRMVAGLGFMRSGHLRREGGPDFEVWSLQRRSWLPTFGDPMGESYGHRKHP